MIEICEGRLFNHKLILLENGDIIEFDESGGSCLNIIFYPILICLVLLEYLRIIFLSAIGIYDAEEENHKWNEWKREQDQYWLRH